MSDESHREAMNHAIRAQRERGNVPRSMLPREDDHAPVLAAAEPMPPEPAPETTLEPEPEPAAKKGFLSRLLGR